MTTKPFSYKIGTTKITLPSLAKLPLGVVRKTRNASDEDRLFITFEVLFTEDSPQMRALDSLEPEGLAELMEAWAEYSGVSLGESKASKRSTKSTKRP